MRGNAHSVLREPGSTVEQEARRCAGELCASAPRTPLCSITAELLAWEDGWEITEHSADWMTSGQSRVAPPVALELRLLALESEGKPAGAVVYALSRLAHGLADAGYEALGPLEVLSRRRSASVRVAVARSFGRLPGTRSLRALTRALDDPDPEVVGSSAQEYRGDAKARSAWRVTHPRGHGRLRWRHETQPRRRCHARSCVRCSGCDAGSRTDRLLDPATRRQRRPSNDARSRSSLISCDEPSLPASSWTTTPSVTVCPRLHHAMTRAGRPCRGSH